MFIEKEVVVKEVVVEKKEKNDDMSLKGEISFKLFLTEPHPDTP